ncbi:MAG TPA: ATP-grasp domain-containing protein [Gaiellaceae bacterium]|nr:ATP-grasp domain-containing protein [Gaiellaceae bacterium]
MSARVCAIVEAGGVPGRNPLLPPLRAELGRAGVELDEWDPTGAFEPTGVLPEADLYLVKGDHPSVLSAAACAAAAGGRCLNDLDATITAADKAAVATRLARAGLPVPPTALVGGRDQLARELERGPRFVKPLRGFHGAGAALLGPGEAERAAGAGPWLVQEPVDGDGWDVKAYGCGDRVALRRMRFEPGRVDGARLPLAPDPLLEELARAAADACGLDLFGVDVLVGGDGPVVVDVNAFPGYRSVPEAPAWVAEAVLRELEAA